MASDRLPPHLDEALVRDFPVLYVDRNNLQSQMSAGFRIPIGWEPLLRELSKSLEILYRDLIDSGTLTCKGCGLSRELHRQSRSIWRRLHAWAASIYYRRTGRNVHIPLVCIGRQYNPNKPRISYVGRRNRALLVQNMGTPVPGSKEIRESYALRSLRTCEVCGKEGYTRYFKRIEILCDTCATGKDKLPPWEDYDEG